MFILLPAILRDESLQREFNVSCSMENCIPDVNRAKAMENGTQAWYRRFDEARCRQSRLPEYVLVQINLKLFEQSCHSCLDAPCSATINSRLRPS